MPELIDLKTIVGTPTTNINVQEPVTLTLADGTQQVVVQQLQKEIVNPEFILNGFVVMFLLIFASNMILRTFFNK